VRGELTLAERLAGTALDAADELGFHPANYGRAEPHLALAMVAIERDRLDDADTHLDELLRVAESGRRPPLEVLAHLQLALLASARGREPDALDALDAARAVLPRAEAPVRRHIDRTALRVALGRGDVDAARALLARLAPSPESVLLAARVRLAAHDPLGAADLLGKTAAPRGHRRLRVEHGLLTALALAGSEPSRARDVLARALAIGKPAGFRRTFVAEGPPLWKLLDGLPADDGMGGYVAGLLDAAYRAVPPARPAPAVAPDRLVDPLSERELTVLRYLASRLSCTEIARELYLSVNTVRSHVKAIYRKLGVSSRADAVRRGHAVGLS
jgi:LuxR family maltose regulon positive regulatory protein